MPALPPLARAVPLICAIALLASAHASEFVWIEGESDANAKVNRHPGWYDQVKKGALSGDEWLHNFGASEGTAEYRFEATAGEHHFWVRANNIAGAALSYQLNGGEWRAIDFSKAIESTNIAANDAPDMRFISWTPAGTVTLKAGANVIAFRMHSGNSNHGGLDCFVLSRKPFAPNARMKPGEKLGLAMPGTWAFEPEPDAFDPTAMFDLRSLNEKVAGESGWLKRTPDGDLALGNGRKARFWAINATIGDDLERARQHARFLAKRGVNMVRLHCAVHPGPGQRIDEINYGQIEHVHRSIAAYREQGIYVTLSPFWAVSPLGEPWGIHGRTGGDCFGLLFWDKTMQAGYKAWIRALFTHPNPHTGVPLAQDAALGIFQIQNEDSLLFWTINGPTLDQANQRPQERRAFMAHHGAWAKAKYGSLDKAREAWKGDAAEGDDFANGLVAFKPIWEWGGDVSASNRHNDQMQYFSETMHAFNSEVERFVRDELACRVLINAGNWRTANQVKMLDLERWSYTANDVIGLNRYVNGIHDGDRVGYLISVGQHFTEHTTLRAPRTLPVSVKQVAGLPFIISESTWVPPISYQAEGPFLVAAYSALNGMDIYYWFAMGGDPGFDRTINKWQCANPAIMGGWPSAALMFRKDYIARGKPAVHEERRLDDLWPARGILIAEDEGFDPNRDSAMPKESTVQQGVDPLAYLVGPVEVVYGGDPAKNAVDDLAKRIDVQNKTVTSNTDQLRFDHGRGICTLDAPKAQGVTGFLAQSGSFPLSTVSIESKADYATILAVALDDKPLKQSARILVNVTSVCRPYGWKVTPTSFAYDKRPVDGFRIDDTGSTPWNVNLVPATLTVRNPKLKKATLLDPNGMAVREVAGRSAGGAFTIELPPDTLYLVLE
ncbi:MAG TPA: hypothetical protein VEL07_01990 [Planctomycetota bacterium]|nr:hypothetical protein [Planctomycetota bacterium]